ncbi:MAG: RsmE family RNA methyltransferase [Halanaerobiales bacterium]
MHRIFINGEKLSSENIIITDDNFNHIAHSLRLNPGDRIIVSNGEGKDFEVELREFFSDRVEARIIRKLDKNNEPGLRVTLAQAIPKNRNMELVVEKVTELGAVKVIPLITRRTVVRLQGKKARKRTARWQRIAKAAAGQSGRSIIPFIEEICTIEELKIISVDYDLLIILRVGEDKNDFQKLFSRLNIKDIESALVIVGPEGDLTEKEVRTLDGEKVGLGPRILRTETAGLVALSILFYLSGDMGW